MVVFLYFWNFSFDDILVGVLLPMPHRQQFGSVFQSLYRRLALSRMDSIAQSSVHHIMHRSQAKIRNMQDLRVFSPMDQPVRFQRLQWRNFGHLLTSGNGDMGDICWKLELVGSLQSGKIHPIIFVFRR